MKSHHKAIGGLLAGLLAGLAIPALAASSTSRLGMARGNVHVTLDGTSVGFTGVDALGRGDKRAAVIAATVSGQAVKALLRVQDSINGTFIDVVFSDTVGNLQTAVDALSLGSTTVGHPAPAKDAIDQSALTVAGG